LQNGGKTDVWGQPQAGKQLNDDKEITAATRILTSVFDTKAVNTVREVYLQSILQYAWLGTTHAYNLLTGYTLYTTHMKRAELTISRASSVHLAFTNLQMHVLENWLAPAIKCPYLLLPQHSTTLPPGLPCQMVNHCSEFLQEFQRKKPKRFSMSNLGGPGPGLPHPIHTP
jgi:hypothetical protein